MRTCSSLVVLLCLSFLCWRPARAAQFKFGAQTITVPDGFDVELVAGPPLVERPIAADFDEQGRLYVADSSGSNEAPEKQLKNPTHRVVCLTDTRGEGRFDQVKVFADKLMFPEGAMWRDGSLYVAAPPSIWKLTDTDGDGIADRREEWMQGKTLTGCANDLHGPYAGPDGWIYWCKGAFAKQTYERPGLEPFVTRAAHIFRCRPDGTGIEPVMTGGMDNPVGVIFTGTGERIFTTTFLQNPGGGKRDGLIHAVYGGVYGKDHDVIDEHPRTGDVLPVLTHLGPAAPCGLVRYSSDVFGREYQDNLFSCCFNLHKVMRHVLIPDGATFKTVDSDFVTSDDPDFHPTGVLEDADGSLIVLNTGGWYKLCCPTSQLAKPDVLGAIYRVRRQGAPKIADPRGLKLNWGGLSSGELTGLLDDPRPSVRQRAIATLAKQAGRAVGALREILVKPGSPEARRNALWALTQIDSAEARTAGRVGLGDADNTVRHVAEHSVSLWRDPAAFGALAPLLRDADPQVRRSAAEGLGRLGNSAAVAPLLQATTRLKAGDRMLEHSLIFALMEIGDREATARGLGAGNSRERRAALIALDQMRNGHLEADGVTPLLNSSDLILKETANWIVSRHQDWGAAVAGFMRDRLGLPEMDLSEARELEGQLAQFSGDQAVQNLLSRTVADGQAGKRARLAALRAMGRAGLKPAPADWIQSVAAVLRSEDAELAREGIATARALALPKGGSPELDDALIRIGADGKFAPAIRLEALAAAGALKNPPSALFEFLLANVKPANAWADRNNAAMTLGRAKLERPQLLVLADVLPDAGPLELSKLLVPFESSKDEALGLILVEKLKVAKAVSSLRVETFKAQIAKYPESVQRSAGELFAKLGVDAAAQARHLDQLLAQMPKGDIRRGQTVFNSPKVACVSCHAIGYIGGQVGPDLTAVGNIRTERDLLESIVYPSASFARSFEPMVVRTLGGDEFNGVLKKDAPEELVLVTGPQTEARIARSDIAEMRPGTVSLMPQGLAEQLSNQELSDLIAFLKNTKWGAH